MTEVPCLFVPNVAIPDLAIYLVGSATIVGQKLQKTCATRPRPSKNKELKVVHLVNACLNANNKTYHFTRVDLAGNLVEYVLEND